MVRGRELILFFLLFTLGLFLVYAYYNIHQTKDKIYSRVETAQIEQMEQILNNIDNHILKKYKITSKQQLFNTMSNDSARVACEEMTAMLLTSQVKYVYMLHLDASGKFRFLLDASKEDKANFNQKFDVVGDEYEKLYSTKKAQVIRQKNMENLYITYLHPVIANGEVIAVFSVDITTEISREILAAIEPLELFFVVLMIISAFLMTMIIMQLFHYFVTKKKIFTDPLTKTFNRNYLEEILPALNLKRYSLAMIDLDRFKKVNDTYGHKTGDFVLSKAAKMIKHSIRTSDVLVRYGGEEFLLLIDSRSSEVVAFDVCERIRKMIEEEEFYYDGNVIDTTISIGLYNHPLAETSLSEAVKKADAMLYEAKRGGRNIVKVYNGKVDSD